jgi:hypothetical protein
MQGIYAPPDIMAEVVALSIRFGHIEAMKLRGHVAVRSVWMRRNKMMITQDAKETHEQGNIDRQDARNASGSHSVRLFTGLGVRWIKKHKAKARHGRHTDTNPDIFNPRTTCGTLDIALGQGVLQV